MDETFVCRATVSNVTAIAAMTARIACALISDVSFYKTVPVPPELQAMHCTACNAVAAKAWQGCFANKSFVTKISPRFV
jgi:hypothetical protein